MMDDKYKYLTSIERVNLYNADRDPGTGNDNTIGVYRSPHTGKAHFVSVDMIVTAAAEIIILEEADREAKWHEFIKRTEPQEEKFKPVLRKAFTKQQKAVLSAMRGKPIPDTSDADKAGWLDISKDPIGKIITVGARNCTIANWTIDVDVDDYHTCFYIDVVYADGSCDTLTMKEPISEEAEAAAETYVDGVFKPAAWQIPFETMALPFVTAAYLESGTAAYAEIGFEAAFNVTNPRAKTILKNRVFKFSKEVNETTQKRLRKALAKGFDKGEDIRALSQRVADVFDISRGSITDRAARTEIVGASNQATHEAYVESKIVVTKIWIDSRDASVRTSPHNHALDGEERKLNQRYSNGLMHPHDPGGAAGNVIN